MNKTIFHRAWRQTMKLRDYLRKHEMSVACFANFVGCSRPSVYNWLDGVTPQASSMRRIIKATDGEVTRADFEERAA